MEWRKQLHTRDTREYRSGLFLIANNAPWRKLGAPWKLYRDQDGHMQFLGSHSTLKAAKHAAERLS